MENPEQRGQRPEQARVMLDHSDAGGDTEENRKRELRASLEHLHGPESVTYGADELIVLCLVRDGRPYLKSFIDHYFSLGVKHIVFLDNGSTDGTVEALKGYDNVTVLRTFLPFNDYQRHMKQYLIERFARRRWSLSVDIDELFDYPYSDVISLASFLGYLNERSYTAVVTQMLDMFSEEPVTDTAVEVRDLPLKERYRFYDISNVSVHDYGAYRRTGGSTNLLANGEISVYRDGIKKTVFPNTEPILTKHALAFLDDEIRPMDGSAHKITNARIANVSCVLFHYKFIDNFYEFVRQAVRQENYMKGSRKHKLWMETLARSPRLHIKGETARELQSVNDLVHNQFLVVSREYMRLVDRKDRKRDAPTPSGESDKIIEAFFQASAEATLQRRGYEQSRQQVEALQRDLAKAQRKNQRLAKTQRRVEILSAKTQDLERQIQNIHDSRGWRLLTTLGRFRAKVLRREPPEKY